jgi:formamidopyrimidine-DNA glycosylase
MPELPEMQALSERLDALLRGAAFSGADAIQFSAVKTFEPPASSFVGRSVERIGRRGKYLVFEFEGPRVLVHLSQGGRVDIEDPPKRTRPKVGVVRFLFAGRPSVLIKEFGSHRKAGWWTLAEGDDGPLARLGPEPFSEDFEQFVLSGRENRRLTTLLRDQRVVAGIGRGYSDDILHAARLSPFAQLSKLDEGQRRILLATVRQVLSNALEQERGRAGGLPTNLKGRFRIHDRYGQPCPECGEPLQRVSFEGYEMIYCPRCQTGGRMLADRMMSRLIR